MDSPHGSPNETKPASLQLLSTCREPEQTILHVRLILSGPQVTTFQRHDALSYYYCWAEYSSGSHWVGVESGIVKHNLEGTRYYAFILLEVNHNG